jgi:hypothetical protein
MKDMQAHLEKLRADAAESKLISDLATDGKKQELFVRLAQHLSVQLQKWKAQLRKLGGKATQVGRRHKTGTRNWNAINVCASTLQKSHQVNSSRARRKPEILSRAERSAETGRLWACKVNPS